MVQFEPVPIGSAGLGPDGFVTTPEGNVATTPQPALPVHCRVKYEPCGTMAGSSCGCMLATGLETGLPFESITGSGEPPGPLRTYARKSTPLEMAGLGAGAAAGARTFKALQAAGGAAGGAPGE